MNDQDTDVLKAGGMAVFNCSIVIDTSFIDLPIHSVTKWRIGGQLIESKNRFTISESISESTTNSTTYYSVLQIVPLLKEDESDLSCSAFVTTDSPNEYIIDSPMANSSLSLSVEGNNYVITKRTPSG